MTKWKVKLVGQPTKQTKIILRTAWRNSVQSLAVWLKTTLLRSMVYGNPSLGIRGISQTPFFKFITSKQGLSELGITLADTQKLLRAYEKSFKVSIRGTRITFKFGVVRDLIVNTPHPSEQKSWMEWVIGIDGSGGQPVINRGFVSRQDLSSSARDHIRLSPPKGGLMLPKGKSNSRGFWQFPKHLQNYSDDWFNQNQVAIQTAIANKITVLLRQELS